MRLFKSKEDIIQEEKNELHNEFCKPRVGSISLEEIVKRSKLLDKWIEENPNSVFEKEFYKVAKSIDITRHEYFHTYHYYKKEELAKEWSEKHEPSIDKELSKLTISELLEVKNDISQNGSHELKNAILKHYYKRLGYDCYS